MSVKSGSDNTKNTQQGGVMSESLRAAGADRAFAGQAEARQAAPRASSRPAILDINSRFKRPIGRAVASAQVTQFKQAIEKVLDNTLTGDARNEFQIHLMDASTSLIALPTLLMTLTHEHEGQLYVGVYQLPLEAGGAKIQSTYVNMGNQPIEIERTAGDTVNDELWDKTTLFLRDTFGPQANYVFCGAMVIYSEIDPEDDLQIQQIVYAATQAMWTKMENDVLGADAFINVGMVGNAVVSAAVDYNPADVFSANGLPVRSNLSISQRVTQANANNQSLHEQQLELTRLDAYVDLIYVKPPVAQWGQAPITQHYFPRVVITKLDSQVDAVNLELQLWALSSGMLAGRQMAWSGVFLPRYNVSGPDLRDIGAIGFEVNLTGNPDALPERIPTKSESFGRRELLNLIGSAIHDQVVYSLDVEEVGPLSWLTQTFIAAANGDADAYAAIVQAANNLTNNQFGTIWNGGAIAVDDNNRIHLGYYFDTNGQKKDLRDIDYLAMLNLLGDKDMQNFHEWVSTFEESSVPLELRLEKRSKLLKALIPEARIKGFARRVTFTADFIAALEAAIQQAGLVVRPTNVQPLEGQTAQRGQFNAAQFAVNSNVGAGLFTFNQAPYGGFRSGMSGPYFGHKFN